MAEVSQYNFALKEVTTALIKQQDIHEGKWAVGFEFNLAAGNAGASLADVRPSAIVGIAGLILVRAKDGEPPVPFLVDAAEINPA